MLHLPLVRWGKPYESLDKTQIVHFETGEPIATVSQGIGGIVRQDLLKAKRARSVLRDISTDELLKRVKRAGELYATATLPMGDGTQTPDEFVRQQSASTGMPENMCRGNMEKNRFVLVEMENILTALTRGLDLRVLGRGYGEERGVPVSYQAQTPVVGAVLPSNSPGVHTLWLPIIPMQIGIVLKPGSSEPWTPYRVVSAFLEAGIPGEAMSLYPGPHEVGDAVLNGCKRSMVFGGQETINKYKHNPAVQPHGPGFSKIFLGDDVVDRWEDYLDVIQESVCKNGGRSCINTSSVWVSRHGREIADALAQRMAKIEVRRTTDPKAELAAFTTPRMADAVNQMIDVDAQSSDCEDVTARYRSTPRLVKQERCDYLLPTVFFCKSPDAPAANKEYMFPFVSVVECPQKDMIHRAGPTLVCTAITDDASFKLDLLEATNIDRLNIGPVPTSSLNWLQPHEGNIVEFLFRNRAYQTA
ncbi:aldehyde dehydrogenase family protein [bacterium]|nr:aldehyde dehydrogenase family protein [bacterium]